MPLDHELIEVVCRQWVHGGLDQGLALAALKEALGPAAAAPARLLAALEGRDGPALRALKAHVRAQLRSEAYRAHQAKLSQLPVSAQSREALEGLPLDVPAGWTPLSRQSQEAASALSLLADAVFLWPRRAAAPRSAAHLEQAYRAAQPAVFRLDPSPWAAALVAAGRRLAGLEEEIARRREADREALRAMLAGGPPPTAPEDGAALAFLAEAFRDAPDREAKRRVLDAACAWPTSRAATAIRDFAVQFWARERAELILVLRFGGAGLADWGGWNAWLLRQEMEDRAAAAALADLAASRAAALLYVWLDRAGTPQALKAAAWEEAVKAIPAVPPEAFAERWLSALPPAELAAIGAAPAPAAGGTLSVPPPSTAPQTPPAAAPVPAAPQPQVQMGAVEKGPSLWEDHLLPFFTQNWPMVTGILMVLVGSSLLAYYTWDKHWLLRYTLMPSLLAAFTLGLARLGRWLEERDAALQGMAHLLRGAAAGLVPVNFMTVTLLSKDPNVSYPLAVTAAASAAYLALFGAGLRAWCAAVARELGGLLGGTLLAVNAAALAAPLARAAAWPVDELRLAVVAFYAAFLAAAAAVRRFAGRVLTREMAEDEKAPWFFGVTLVGTFVEVFLWIHGSRGRWPPAAYYAPLVAGAGGLVLLVERQASALRETPEAYRAESFLGFAFLLLGAFMGMADPWIRPAALGLAGGLWLAQTASRKDPLHHWIGLTLLALGGASVGLWDLFPRAWWPALGIGVALLVGGVGRLAPGLAGAAARMQGTVLALSTVVAGLVQWRLGSPPLLTAGFLTANAALLLRRGLKDEDLVAVHTALGVAALALPYLGCADMAGRTLRGNTLAFGLGVLSFAWLALVRLSGSAALRAARSTGLWLYGALATTAVAVRVLLEQGRPAEAMASQFALDYGGPALMTAALLVAAYLSRSLVPSILAAAMTAVLLPEMKMIIHERLPWISFGSGLATALWSLAAVLAAFPLREAAFLKDLDEGDLFNGKTPFPLRRRDHTLFTGPLVAVAMFLAVKADTWNLFRNLIGDGVGVKTAAGLLAAGAAWTLLAVYLRARADAAGLAHLGWMSAAAGVAFGYWKLAPAPAWHGAVVIAGVFLQVFYGFYRSLPAPWVRGLLAEPLRRALMAGGVLFSVVACGDLLRGEPAGPLLPILAFTALQLAWHGLSERKTFFGVLLFCEAVIALLAWVTPGAGDLVVRFSAAHSLTPLLLFFLGVAAVHLALEAAPAAEEAARPLLAPFLALSSAGTLLLGLGAFADLLAGGSVSFAQHALLLAALLAFARAQGSGLFVLAALLAAYVLAQFPELRALEPPARGDLLLSPWRVGALALASALLGAAGRWAAALAPGFASGPFAQVLFKCPALPFAWGLALGAGFAGPVLHLGAPSSTSPELQLLAPYLGAAAYWVVSRSVAGPALFGAAVFLLTLGNVHVIRHYAGDWLAARGLAAGHLLAIGATASLAELLPFRAAGALRRAELALAGLVLAVLAGSYIVQPDLGVFTTWRFLISGAMALAAGLYFLRAARRPDEAEAPFAAACEGVYHYALTTAFWCAALLVPWFRRPEAAFLALGLPVVLFYLRAELGGARGAGYGKTAAFLSFLMWGLYFFHAAFQMVTFPEAPVGTAHYHLNAPWVLLLGLVMLRLRGMGGTGWLGFYGGLAVMGGSYFTLTRWPGMSPFAFPVPSAWCALALGHFWILATARRSPVRAGLQRLGGLDDVAWTSLRRSWGVCLLAATQAAAGWGLSDFAADTRQAAPLLAGAASVFLHAAGARRSALYGLLGAAELLVALHMDFLVPSHLPKDAVVWVLLALWAAGSLLRLDPAAMGAFSLGMAAATLAHVVYHHPASSTGLWAAAAGALVAALTPRKDPVPASAGESLAAGAFLVVPAWLAYFRAAPFLTEGPAAALHPEAVLSALAALYLTACAAKLFQERAGTAFLTEARPAPRLYHQTLSWAAVRGGEAFTAVLVLVAAGAGAVQASHYGEAFTPRELGLLLGLHGASAAAWFQAARRTKALSATLLLQFSVVAFFAAVRRQLMLETPFWSYEYDVWASLAVSALLTGFKRIFDLQPAGVRFPMVGALIALPAVAMSWALIHHMGTHVVLLIVGLHSVLFTHLGKDDRESPYNVVAVAGFVSFVLIVFWTELGLRALHAYVIPVGLGVLLLLHLLRARVSTEAANAVRLLTLLAMLGSAGYYALMDPRFPLAFHMTLILLGLLAMALGAWLKVRVYLFLGFTGVAVDLASILYRVLVHMDRGARMTLIGGQVLAVGAALVFGAVYYKTHQEQITAALERWRDRLRAWE